MRNVQTESQNLNNYEVSRLQVRSPGVTSLKNYKFLVAYNFSVAKSQ